MENSAMLRAFQMLRKKPILLLLLLPMQAVQVLILPFMPDFSTMLNYTSFAQSSFNSYMLSNVVFMLASSMASIVSLAGMFLLLPQAMELMSDGSAGRETAPGWYARGLRRHWWKPVVSSMIISAISGAVVMCFYLLMLVASIVLLVPLINAGHGQLEGGALAAVIAAAAAMVFLLVLISLVLQAFFAPLLPALAEKKFGDAFKLVFSRKALRQLPRILGGYLLISFVSGLAVCAAGALYVIIAGVPEGPTGPLLAIMGFLRSGAGVISLLLSAVIGVILVPFQFAVYRKIEG